MGQPAEARARGTDWYRANRETILAKRREPEYKAHRSEVRRAHYQANRERLLAERRQYVERNQVRVLLIDARGRAKQRGLEFDITVEDVVIPEACPLLGIRLQKGVGQCLPGSPSLDRIDPAKGYVRGNVWVISRRANVAKNDLTLAELERLVSRLREKVQQCPLHSA